MTRRAAVFDLHRSEGTAAREDRATLAPTIGLLQRTLGLRRLVHAHPRTKADAAPRRVQGRC
ncbi:MAG: hypothetical protein WBN14_15015, partial [Polyangiales bacterium]